jgi:hypothetical protein
MTSITPPFNTTLFQFPGASFSFQPQTPKSAMRKPDMNSFSEKKVSIRVNNANNSSSPQNNHSPHRGLERKSSNNSMKSSFSLVARTAASPIVANNLKPEAQLVRTKSGFNLLKDDAHEIRRAVDPSSGLLWTEWQAANTGPIFYTKEVVNSVRSGGAVSVGQWAKPEVFVKLDRDSEAKFGSKSTHP